jgi:Sulfotransferase domain
MMLQKAIVKVIDVLRIAPNSCGAIHAYHLDRPKKGEYYSTHNFTFSGWILGKKSPILRLELVTNTKVVQTILLNHPRPDVLAAYPDISVAQENVGFSTAIEMEQLCDRETSKLLIQAVFEDESKEPLVSLTLSCQTLEYDSLENLGPDFLIVGAMKAATSAIYDYLGSHPRVIRRYPKELHFFTLHFEQGLEWYLSQFSPVRQNKQGQPLLTGEASPTYLVDPNAPGGIHKLFPKVKVIASLRNPTDRAISHYYHQVKRVKNETRSIEEAFSEKELEKITTHRASATKHYIQNGLYAQHLQNWFNVFPREQMLLLNYHALETHPDEFVKQIFMFLELQDFLPTNIEKIYANQYSQPPLEVKQRLDDFFKLHNQELEKLLDVELLW